MIDIDAVQLKIGETIRDLYFRPQSSDIRVIEQIFQNHDYNLRQLRRFPEIARFVGLSKASQKRPLIVDAGANIGASPVYFKVKSPDSLVVAIEPDIGNYRLLLENTKGLDITPLNAAVASKKTRVQVVDVGEGFWGYQTRQARAGEQGSVGTTTINDIYQVYSATHFPYIVKIDIEGGEKDLFSDNLEWVEKTPLIIIELHDWLLGGQGTARPFLQCVANLDRDFIYVGENIYSIANNLSELSTLMEMELLGMKSSPEIRSQIKSRPAVRRKAEEMMIGPEPGAATEEVDRSRPFVDTTQEFQSNITLLRKTRRDLEDALTRAEQTAVELRHGTEQLRQELAASYQTLSDTKHEKENLQHALASSETELSRLRTEITQQREQIAASEMAVARLHDQAAQRREQMVASEELIVQLRHEAAQQRQQVVASEELVSRLRDEAAQLREQMVASDELVVRLRDEVVQQRAQTAASEQVVAQLREQMVASDELVVRLRDEVAQQRAQAAAAEQEVARLREETAQLQQQQNYLRDAAAVSERVISDLRAEATRLRLAQSELQSALLASKSSKETVERELNESLVSFNRTISDQRELIMQLDAESKALSTQLEHLVRSTSWKISAPMRMLGRRLPSVARLFRRIMRPFWRLAYIVLRRSEPVIARSSVIPLIPEDAFSSPASPDSDAPRPSEPMEQQPAAGEHFDAARVQSTKEPLPLAPDAMAAFNALQSVPGRKLVLVAADAPPMFDKHAGGLRLYNTVRIICEMGWSVVFASEAAREKFNGIAGSVEDRKRYERLLYDAGVEQIVYGAEETEALLRAIGDRLRWAFLSFALVAEQLIPKVRIHAPWATVIYDMVDFHALRMHREAQLTSNTNLKAAADRMHAVELMNARTADVTVAVSEAERQALLEIEPNLVVDVIPTVFDIPPGIRLDIDGRSGLLYVGGFWHTPNVDAVLWFVREVWPLIRRERPDMIFRVAGSNPSDEILALRGQPGIEVLGYVPDLTDLFATSRMSVAPLRYGAGVKGKVGQSMVYGLPVVATSVGAEGMAIENGKHILVADTPEEFAAAVLRLASDDDLWRTLQKNGRHFIEGAQSLDVLRNTLKALMNV